MIDSPSSAAPAFDNILHPSDFSEASEVAFVHALKLALVTGARLTLLHVVEGQGTEWTDFPSVRATLVKWGLLPQGSPKSAVHELGIQVRKVIETDADPAESVLHYLGRHGADLVVLAPHRHAERVGWLHHSVSEPILRNRGQMTLLVPAGVRGFVSVAEGSVSLRSMVIPITNQPRPQPAIAAAMQLAHDLKCPEGIFTLVHIGDEGTMPAVATPEFPGWQWQRETIPGGVVEGIVGTARRHHADLIVMGTDGRHGFLDALRGSHSERVLRHAPCPLLAVPENDTLPGASEPD